MNPYPQRLEPDPPPAREPIRADPWYPLRVLLFVVAYGLGSWAAVSVVGIVGGLLCIALFWLSGGGDWL